MNHSEREAELAERIRACADEYLYVVHAIQQEFVRMTRGKKDTGHFPEDSHRIMLSLSQKGKRLSIRMLRLRADMIEAGLTSAFDGETVPDELPEDW